jgi:hypothetical protein
MGHSPHSSTLVVICVVLLLFVLFYVLFVCKCVLPLGDNQTAVNKYIIITTHLCQMAMNYDRGNLSTHKFWITLRISVQEQVWNVVAIPLCTNLLSEQFLTDPSAVCRMLPLIVCYWQMKCLTRKKCCRLLTLLMRQRPVNRLTSVVQYKKKDTVTYVTLMTSEWRWEHGNHTL